MATEIELIEAMSVLTLQQGDVVVLKTPIQLTYEQSKNIVAAVKNIIGNKNEVLILVDGLDIGVLRQAA